MTNLFVGYLNDPDIHDAVIIETTQERGVFRVKVQTPDGRVFAFEFRNVESIKMNHPKGMMLYALSEMRETPPARKFVFGNWDEEDDAFLEVVAHEISSHEIFNEMT